MNLKSPVKMLLQDVKTHLVPDSKTVTECSTIGSADGKRNAGPDALAAPDAKKSATSPGLPKSSIPEDNTSLEGSSESDDDIPLDYDLFASDEESEPEFPDGEERIVYDTRCPYDVKALGDAVAKFHERNTPPYYERVNLIKQVQFRYEKLKVKGRRMRLHVLLDKEGSCIIYSLFRTL